MLPSFNNLYLKVCSFGIEITLSQSASSFLSANPLFSFSFFHFPVCIFLKNAFCYPFSQDFPSEVELHSQQTSLISFLNSASLELWNHTFSVHVGCLTFSLSRQSIGGFSSYQDKIHVD